MKQALVIFIALFGFQMNSFADSGAELRTVPYVDVSRYLGTWYQIARNPLIFEGNCVCARQVLGLAADKNVTVYNSCNESLGGPLREIRGFAYSQDPATNARFTIDFGLPHKGQYWVIGLDPNYQWAVVSDPSKKSLYIVSKSPTMEPDQVKLAIAEAQKQLDVSKLVYMVQQGCTYP